jgi:hypothetical protein
MLMKSDAMEQGGYVFPYVDEFDWKYRGAGPEDELFAVVCALRADDVVVVPCGGVPSNEDEGDEHALELVLMAGSLPLIRINPPPAFNRAVTVFRPAVTASIFVCGFDQSSSVNTACIPIFYFYKFIWGTPCGRSCVCSPSRLAREAAVSLIRGTTWIRFFFFDQVDSDSSLFNVITL